MKSKFIKPFIIGYLFFAGAVTINAQSMVDDALSLSRHARPGPTKAILDGTNTAVYAILDKYVEPQKPNTRDDIGVAIAAAQNPFIDLAGTVQDDSRDKSAGGALISGLISNVGGLNITGLADALAIVVVDRLKTELNEEFFDEFEKQLAANPELNTLFPYTYSLLKTVDDGIYNYESYIPALRQAFNTDLKNLYQKVDAFFNTPKFKEYLKTAPEVSAVIGAAIITSKLVSQDKSPAHVISGLADASAGAPEKVEGLFKTVGIIAKSLYNSANAVQGVWVGMDSVKKLVNDPVALKIYVGLLYQTSEKIQLGDGKTLRSELDKLGVNKNLNKIADIVVVVSTAVKDVEELIGQYKADTALKGYNKYYDYYESYTTLVKTLAISVDTIFDLNINNRIEQYYAVSQNLGNIYLNVNEGNYTGAITNLVATINIVDSNAKVLEKPVVQKILRYGTFMAAMVEADNSQEMADVLNTFILPSGSSSDKSKNSVLLTLNSYIGGFYSGNAIQSDSMNRSTGLTLPIGPNFSFRLFKKCKGWEPAIFVPIVDIGAFGSYRLTDSSSTALPAVKLANIFAPGIMVGFNRMFNSPLTLMGGVQKTPPLQTIAASGATYLESSWRWQVSLTWDIPLFNLYYKSKK